MNTNEPTQSLNEAVDNAPSTSPLLKELLADVRELKADMRDLKSAIADLGMVPEILKRIDQRLESIEHEQRVARVSVERLTGTHSHFDARVSVLEQDVLTLRHRAM